MADVIITGNVQTLTSSGSTTPAVTITSSVEPGITVQGNISTGGTGPQGPAGAAGANGQDGAGVPSGGTTGQVLAKNSGTDNDTAWETIDFPVDSVNGSTGTVVLDPDDLDDTSTTNKFVTASDLTKLGNLSGTNTGDQDLSGYVQTTRTVNGHALSANVTVTKSDLSLGNVDNTSDANKPVSTATQTALDLKADDSSVVHDTGSETIAGVKTFSSDPIVPDEAYGSGWNGSLEPPTKNALYDKIETISGGGGVSEEFVIGMAVSL